MLLSCFLTMALCRFVEVCLKKVGFLQLVCCWFDLIIALLFLTSMSPPPPNILQVNFYTDHTKIILCKSSDDSYLLTYISRERVSYTYLLSMLNEMGCTPELRHRLRYVVQLLQHHTDAWEHCSLLLGSLSSRCLRGSLTGWYNFSRHCREARCLSKLTDGKLLNSSEQFFFLSGLVLRQLINKLVDLD